MNDKYRIRFKLGDNGKKKAILEEKYGFWFWQWIWIHEVSGKDYHEAVKECREFIKNRLAAEKKNAEFAKHHDVYLKIN